MQIYTKLRRNEQIKVKIVVLSIKIHLIRLMNSKRLNMRYELNLKHKTMKKPRHLIEVYALLEKYLNSLVLMEHSFIQN